MSFRELLERYRTGAATEAERALVEAELEKSAAISDYLAEGLEAELTGEGALQSHFWSWQFFIMRQSGKNHRPGKRRPASCWPSCWGCVS